MKRPWKIPFGTVSTSDLARYYVLKALDTNQLSEGPNVRQFEETLAILFGYKHAIAVSSGTDAGIVTWAAIRELSGAKWGEGEVITPVSAYFATASCLFAAGLRPRFVDVSEETLNINPALVRELITSDTIGIQFVCNMGMPRTIDEVAGLANSYRRWMAVDNCEGHGAKLFGIDAGKYGKAAFYSFYPAHIIIAGEGGAIVTDSDEIADLCRSIKCHGRPTGSLWFDFQRVGYNSKFNELCAGVGLESLTKFDQVFKRRREIRQMMIDGLSGLDWLRVYPELPGEIVCPHAMPLVLREMPESKTALVDYLIANQIETKTLFSSLATNHAALSFMGHTLGEFPIAESLDGRGCHIGLSQSLSDEDVQYVIDTVRNYRG